MNSSPSGPSRRARAPVLGIQTVACLVDGCTADLSKCKDYHRRHKVCELHSKTPRVTIGGHEQRFCQQCSRFHSLVEFDEVKRSCRKRLDGHNRRRRKPQLETASLTSGSFLPNHQGTKYLNFGGRADDDAGLYTRHSQLDFVRWQHSSTTGSLSHGVRPLFDHKCSSSSGQQKCCDGLDRVLDSEDGHVHSLLSSSLAETQDSALSCCITRIPPQAEAETFMPSLNCQGMFQIGPHGPSSSGPNHRLSFSWD